MRMMTHVNTAASERVKQLNAATPLRYSRRVLEQKQGVAAREFLAWADHHARCKRLHRSHLTQITAHPDPMEPRNVSRQATAWGRRRDGDQRLQRCSLAHLREQRSCVA